MGKATEYDERQSAKFLTSDEIRRRRAAAEIGDDDVVATLDHTLARRKPSEPPQEVFIPPAERWD